MTALKTAVMTTIGTKATTKPIMSPLYFARIVALTNIMAMAAKVKPLASVVRNVDMVGASFVWSRSTA